MAFIAKDPLLGTRFDGWHLQAHLGHGNMGQLYRAVRHDGTVAALKVLHASLTRDPELLERFARELRNTARISHPNVVGCYGEGRTPQGQPYLALEYLQGETLDSRIEAEAPFDLGCTVHIAVQIARGLTAAHQVSVVHRDLKPENVMLLDDERVKLFDFGLARARVPNQPSITAQDMRLGTPMFMAPEYIAEGQADHRSDLYALGVVLFEMATGRDLFTGPAFKIMHLHVTEPAPNARSVRIDVDPALDALIARLLEKDPLDRPQSAQEVADTLLALIPG